MLAYPFGTTHRDLGLQALLCTDLYPRLSSSLAKDVLRRSAWHAEDVLSIHVIILYALHLAFQD